MEIGKELAERGLKALDNTTQFVAEQAPDFIQEVLVFKMAENGINGILLLGMAALIVYVIHRICQAIKEHDEDSPWFLPYVFTILAFIPFAGAVDSLTSIVKIWLAPKLYLMEFFASLLKK